jgi:tRNA(Ile)-lysidine synthase
MLVEFQRYIQEKELFFPHHSILLAVSGGIDSTVMAHLFHQAGFKFGIAHCNFSLRNNDSDFDEVFVRSLALELNVPFFTQKFHTATFAKENHLGIQEAARMLRYDWFETLIKQESFDFLATAHHLDDNIETLMFNLLRGCGINGLHGIPPQRKKIIRPLLFATRNDIEQFAFQHHIQYREDSSNKQAKYTRNKIRHYLIPVMAKIQPHFRAVMSENINRFQEAEMLFQRRIEQIKSDIVQHTQDNSMSIDIKKLQNTEAPKTVLFEILSSFGFHKETIPEIMNALDGQSGKKFLSEKFILLKDRNSLLLYAKKEQTKANYFITPETVELLQPLHLKISNIDVTQDFKIEKKINIAYLDYEQLTFPLILRKPKNGDAFVPFGMKGRKKLSDFMIDQKFSQAEKEATWILCSGNEIVWIVNHRINELHRITKNTKKVFIIESCRQF